MATNDEKVTNNLSKHGCIIRIALLGDPNVGYNTLASPSSPTPHTMIVLLTGSEKWQMIKLNVKILLFHWKNIETHLRSITLACWVYMLHAAVFIVDVTNHKTLTSSVTFLTKLSNVPSCAKANVGNKRDFLSKHTTPIGAEGIEIGKKMSIPVCLTNAITGENVEHVIVSIAAEALVAVSNTTLPCSIR